MNPMDFPYYYGQEAIQYTFYRIPKLLFSSSRFQDLDAESKVLYGLLLDRMQLSLENGWVDEENRVYVYFTVEDAMKMLGCRKEKALKLFAKLDEKTGVGLIERKRQGQGKPIRIYVKRFYEKQSGS